MNASVGRRSLNPDLLLGAFASALACNALTPIVVKWILESEGFYEPGKLTLEEASELLLEGDFNFLSKLAEQPLKSKLGEVVESKLREVVERLQKRLQGVNYDQLAERSTSPPELAELQARAVFARWQSIQELWKSRHGQREAWKMVLEGKCNIVSPLDPELARELARIHAYEQLTRLEHPKLNAPPLELVPKRAIESIRKPSHRPPSGKEGVRFRTAAVAAVAFHREAEAGSRDSWKWVADHLNRAGVRRPKGAPFKDKTIKNWSSKGDYSQHLYKGMKSLANASLFRARTRAQVAECAVTVAVHFGKAATKKTPKLPLLRSVCS